MAEESVIIQAFPRIDEMSRFLCTTLLTFLSVQAPLKQACRCGKATSCQSGKQSNCHRDCGHLVFWCAKFKVWASLGSG